VIRFITEHKDLRIPLAAGNPAGGQGLRWGVEPMCAVLTEHGIKISASTYYEWVNAKPTQRELRDAEIITLLVAERSHPKTGKLAATLGSRKMWIRLRGKGHDVARCTVERLMRQHGWEGARYGSKHRTTIPDEAHERAPDLVDRDFNPLAPNRLWVADFTYVPTWTGTVYVAFVIDAYARRIIGWRAARSMTTALVLDALEHAFFTRTQEGVTDLSGLIAHNHAGSPNTPRRTSRPPVAGCRSPSRWAGSAPPWTMRSSRVGTPPWSSSCVSSSTSTPRPRHVGGSRRGSRSTTTTDATPRSGCAPRSPTRSH